MLGQVLVGCCDGAAGEEGVLGKIWAVAGVFLDGGQVEAGGGRCRARAGGGRGGGRGWVTGRSVGDADGQQRGQRRLDDACGCGLRSAQHLHVLVTHTQAHTHTVREGS